MSLRQNVIAGYVAQAIVMLVGIMVVPVYLRYMGREGYALVGLFSVVQGWFQFLDMGLTPTVARETARYRAGVMDAGQLRRLLRLLKIFVVGAAILAACLLALGASSIARRWLHVDQLPLLEVERAIALIGAVVGVRWASGLYRAIITGFERLVLLSCFNVAIAIIRFILVIPVLRMYGQTPSVFFCYQVGVAVAEFVILAALARRLIPSTAVARAPSVTGIRAGLAETATALRFSGGVAVTSGIWVLVTQTDKVILSSVLPLGDYAYLALAVSAAYGVTLVGLPISAALLPRLSKLTAESRRGAVMELYHSATQGACVLGFSAALVMAAFSKQLLWAWTGNPEVAEHAAPVLALYSLGNAFLLMNAFPYYLQFASGNLRLHIIGSALFLCLLVPMLMVGARRAGVIGAGYAWLGANAAYFAAWVPFVHSRLLPGLHARWLFRDIAAIALSALCAVLIIALTLAQTTTWPVTRVGTAIWIVAIGAAVFCVAVLSAPSIREAVRERLGQSFAKSN